MNSSDKMMTSGFTMYEGFQDGVAHHNSYSNSAIHTTCKRKAAHVSLDSYKVCIVFGEMLEI